MRATLVPWGASSATITLANVIKSLVRVAPSAGAVSLRTHSFVTSQCSLHAFPAAPSVPSGSILIVAVFHTGNGRSAGHIQKMEKFIALTVVIAVVVFAATYGLSAWSEHR
jgi:hypothetical protein